MLMSILRLMLFLARVLASGTITLQWGQTADQKGVTTPPRTARRNGRRKGQIMFSLFLKTLKTIITCDKYCGGVA